MVRDAGGWRDAAGGRGGVDDPHAVRAGRAEFGDGVSEGAEGCDLRRRRRRGVSEGYNMCGLE